jgi:hypothetical protein
MIRKLLVIAAAVAMPVSVVAVTSGVAGAKVKPPTAATDTATCSGLSGTISFSEPLTNAGYPSGIETTTVSGTLSGCTASGGFAVSGLSATLSGTFAGKAGSAKHPSGVCTGLLGATKEKGSIAVGWTSSPPVPNTTISLKSAAGGVGTNGNASFSLTGSYKGSFGGADKGKSSSVEAYTTASVGTLAAECAGAGISSLTIVSPPTGNPITLG